MMCFRRRPWRRRKRRSHYHYHCHCHCHCHSHSHFLARSNTVYRYCTHDDDDGSRLTLLGQDALAHIAFATAGNVHPRSSIPFPFPFPFHTVDTTRVLAAESIAAESIAASQSHSTTVRLTTVMPAEAAQGDAAPAQSSSVRLLCIHRCHNYNYNSNSPSNSPR